jgi:hypothetical protein
MSESIILITVIATALLNPILTYLVNSRCSKIKCCCIECDREVLNELQDLTNNRTEGK